jgi:hypothetical protein
MATAIAMHGARCGQHAHEAVDPEKNCADNPDRWRGHKGELAIKEIQCFPQSNLRCGDVLRILSFRRSYWG